MSIPASLCVKCKGRLWCKLPKCPILEKFETHKKQVSLVKGKEFSGSSPPSVFVSWQNYPNVSIAPLSPPSIEKDADLLDNPERWFGLQPEEIVSFREQLIRSSKKENVHSANNPGKELSDMQELVMARKPVNAEFKLEKAPEARLSFHDTLAPLGPTAKLEKMRLTENPRIPKKVQYFYDDVDAKSQEAIMGLYSKHFPVHFLHKLLSAGTLGVKKQRKLVPTRWSITAIDSNVSGFLINEKVKRLQEISEHLVFNSDFLHNNFYVLLIPSAWSFEMLESWMPGGGWAAFAEKNEINVIQDHEFYEGRKKYADNITGAYYAARLAVAEHLCNEKRQSACIVFREIGSDYNQPLGVWQIRENVRNAFSQKPISFSELGLALSYIESKLKVPFKLYKQNSKLLDKIKNQKTLKEWF